MEQILFLFDLDQILPLQGSVNEDDQECRLNFVKESCLRILLRESHLSNKDNNVIPHFGYRYFSSTDYHPSGEQLPGHFKQVSLETFSEMETSLEDRFRTITQNAIRQNNANPHYFSTYLKSKGHRTPCEKIRSSLEEAVVLFDWDRPSIASPVKSGDFAGSGGNQIYVVTRVPNTRDQADTFLSNPGKLLTHRDFTQALFSKNVKSVFSGYLKISLSIVDTSGFFSDSNPDIGLRTELERSIKTYKGSLIRIESLCAQLNSTEDVLVPAGSILQPGAPNPGLLPSSAVLRSLLSLSKSKPPPDSLSDTTNIELKLGDKILQFECSASVPCGALAECRGYFVRSSLNFKLKAKASVTVSSPDELCQSLLRYLLVSNKYALFHTADAADTLLMSADSLSVGTLQYLETSDANFLALMFKLRKLDVEPVNVRDQLQEIPLSSLQCSYRMELSQFNSRGFWDVNALEAWRTRDNAGFRFLEKMKLHRKSKGFKEVKMSRSRLRQQTREQYSMTEQSSNPSEKREIRRRSSELQDRLMYDTELESRLQRGNTMKKHISEMSNVSSASRSSRSSGIGTLSGSGAPEGESEYTSIQMIAEIKAGKATMLLNEMLEEQDLTDSNKLIAHLTTKKRELVEMEDQDPINLAGFAESCVSIILKHLDTAGIPKTNLEEFVSEHILLAVGQVSTQYSSENQFRLNEHKVQTLLLGEILWLLANKDTITRFEETMLDHLRQISFHHSPGAMANFLKDVLLPCFINKQDNLLCVLYDELDQDRPYELNQMFSPDPCSTAPSSNTSLVSSVSSATHFQEPKDTEPMQKRIPMARHKSFDAINLNRQIAVKKGGSKKSGKLGSMEIEKKMPSKKVSVKEKARQVISARRESARKAVVSHKSPKKSVHQARRNLCFDKSPMKKLVSPTKKVTTPVKKLARKTPQKLTPGKRHRIMVPCTPTAKQVRRKSDGNRSVIETPDKEQASKSILDKSQGQKSFYRDNNSRNSRKYEETLNASLLSSTVSDPLFISREVASRQNKSINIFSQILDRKRKRDSSEDCPEELENKVPRLTESGDGPRVRTRKRLISFSDEPANQPIPGKEQRTPSKSTISKLDGPLSPAEVIGATPRKETGTPKKLLMEESPFKKVSFNTSHLSATPRREGHVAKSILKTPSKTPDKENSGFDSKPVITPVRSARTLSYTPKKSPAARRDISSPGGKCFKMFHVSSTTSDSAGVQTSSSNTKLTNTSTTPNITPCKAIPEEEKTSPIITSSMKKKKKVSQDSMSSVPDLHGFPTPSPNRIRDVNVGLMNIMNKIKISPDKPLARDAIKDSSTNELDLMNEGDVFEPLATSPEKSRPSGKNVDNRGVRSSPRFKDFCSRNLEDPFSKKSDIKKNMNMVTKDSKVSESLITCVEEIETTTSNQPKSVAMPFFHDEDSTDSHQSRRTSPRKNVGKRRNAESTMLDDKLTQYFSPKSKKRATKPREDVQDNMAIANALMKRSPKRKASVKGSKPSTPSLVREDKAKIKNSETSSLECATPLNFNKLTAGKPDNKLQDEFASHATPVHQGQHPGSSKTSTTKKQTQRPTKRFSIELESRPIETPGSELAFDLNASREQTELHLDQSSDFYQCNSCKQTFADKKEYISHYKICLLNSKPGILFDKVKEKTQNEEPEEQTNENRKKQNLKSRTKTKTSRKKKMDESDAEDDLVDPENVEKSTVKSRSAKNKTKAQPEPQKKTPVKRKRKVTEPEGNEADDLQEPMEHGQPLTPNRRSIRSRAPVSYEEADIEGLFSPKKGGSTPNLSESDATPTEPPPASRLSRKKFVLFPAKGANRDRSKMRTEGLSPSAKRHLANESMDAKGAMKVVTVKTMNVSQEEIVDLDKTVGSSDEFKSPTPEKMGKFFSIGKIVETPDGKFTIKLNRVTKPSDISNKHSSPSLRDGNKSKSKETPVKQSRSKPSSKSNTPTMSLFPMRISRSAAKDIGVSPSKLQRMIMDSPKRKTEAFEPGTPDKENLPRTPKIRFKRVKTSSAISDGKDQWTSETVISPVKRSIVSPVKSPQKFAGVSPLKRIQVDDTGTQNSVKMSDLGNAESPARILGGPGPYNFSPLSSSSIHKLHTSPLVPHQFVPSSKDERRKGKRVNKQLYS